MNKPIIRFSHRYIKMPDDLTNTMLLAVFTCQYVDLGQLFIGYDTLYIGKDKVDSALYHYPLPKGKLLVLLLITVEHVWTTIRRWTPEKERYYRSLVGQDVEIEINEISEH